MLVYQVTVRTATHCDTPHKKIEVNLNLIQILNFKPNFYQEFELFPEKNICLVS